MSLRHFRRASRLCFGMLASAALWFFLVNRILIQWVDGPLKTAAIVALGLALGAAGTLPVLLGWRGPWGRLGAFVLVVFALGEGRRAWLRHAYETADVSPLTELFHPVTTTDLSVRHFTVPVPGLAPHRLRVVHLSDLHVNGDLPNAYFQRIHAAIREAAPDVVVMTGDYLSRADRLPRLTSWLDGLPRAPLGAFAVLGNHDYWVGLPSEIRATLSRAGVNVIGGSCTTVAVEDRRVRLCGTDAPWGPGFEPTMPPSDVSATLVLSHTPDNVYSLAEQGATAVFAGHTHGGQFRLPMIGALVVPSRFGRRFDRGHFSVEGTHLFVSAGVGADAPPLRLWCPPELVVVDFVGQVAS